MKRQAIVSLLLVVFLLAGLLPTAALAAEAQHFDSVTVAADGSLDVVEGAHISLIVDGVETEPVAGQTYRGDVYVTASEEFTVIQSAGGSSGGSGDPPAGGGGPGGSSGEAAVAGEETESSSLANRSILGTELINSSTNADFRTALYVDADGVNGDYSVTQAIATGFFTAKDASNLTIRGGSASFGALVLESTSYTLTGADIRLDTESDGTETNDFTGLGSAISVYGSGALLTLKDSYVETAGAAKPALYINGGADVVVYNSELVANGGTVYDTYMSNATSGTMLSPPWHLGIDSARGNSRTINLMGTGTTETLVDSYVYAAGWGALSVDNGSYMRMDIINTEAEVDEGYGAFAIGQVTENYYGSVIESGVYGFILMGGNVYMQDYTGGETITVKRMEALGEGKDQYYGRETDEVVCEVASETVKEGKTVTSALISDRFGVEMHSMMNGDIENGFHMSDGSLLRTGETAFVLKAGFAELSLTDCEVELGVSPYTGEQVLLQVMDNDDAFCSTGGTGAFDEHFWEPAGWSFQFGETDGEEYGALYDIKAMDYGTESGASYGQWTADMELLGTDVTGDLWNSSGYWKQGGTEMRVIIGAEASVTGVISSGAYAHPQKTYETGLYGFYKADGVDLADNTWYNSENRETWENAKYISVVENTPYFYGANGTVVTLEDGGVWNLTDVSFVTGLTVDGGELNGAEGIWKVTLAVEDRDGMTDAVSVKSCEAVDWDGGDIALSAEDIYTVYVLIPAGGSIDDVIVVGEALGAKTADFEGEYLGSFYLPEEGVLETPLDIY